MEVKIEKAVSSGTAFKLHSGGDGSSPGRDTIILTDGFSNRRQIIRI
jgi:hypothetical protein